MSKRPLFTIGILLFVAAIAGPMEAQSGTIFWDDFESYVVDQHPSPPWIMMFPGVDGRVSNEQANSLTQSYKSVSFPTWVRTDYVSLGVLPNKLVYRVAVFITTPNQGATVGLLFKVGSNEVWTANAVVFGDDHNVYFWTRTAGNAVVGTWAASVWHEVEVLVDFGNDLAEVYLDGAHVGQGLGADANPVLHNGTFYQLDKFGMNGNWKPGGVVQVVYYDDVAITSIPDVVLDIKPGSCPNPLNIKMFQNQPPNANPKKGGVLPVALLGSSSLDVNDVDVSSLLLEGVAPLRHDFEDVAAPVEDGEECECTEAGPDGHVDLTLKFRKSEIAAALGFVSDGDTIALTLTGELLDGTPFETSDCVRIGSKEPVIPDLNGPNQVVVIPATPNPFNPVTRIGYVLPTGMDVTLTVYDVNGRVVERLVTGFRDAGEHVVEWNATGIASGVYFYRLQTRGFTETRRMILLK